MEFKIFILSLLVTIVGYVLVILYRYFTNKWQWSCLFPGKFIYPPRIKKLVRASVLNAYKVQNVLSLQILKDSIEDQLRDAKIDRCHIHKFERIAKAKPMGEVSFKYYLFLWSVNQMLRPKSQNGLKAEIVVVHARITALNEYISKTYFKKAIGMNDRSIILAEIIRRIGSANPEAYDDDFYGIIAKRDVIERYEEIISTVAVDPAVSWVLNYNGISNSSIFNKPVLATSDSYTVNFWIRVILFTKWL